MGHYFLQKSDAVHARHFDIQGDDVRFKFQNFIPGHKGVGGRTHHLNVGGFGQLLGEYFSDYGRIVDNQYFYHDIPRCFKPTARGLGGLNRSIDSNRRPL